MNNPETARGSATRKTGAETPLAQVRFPWFAAAAVSGTPQETGTRAGQIRPGAVLLAWLAALLAVSLGVLQLPDSALRAPIIWVAGNQIVLFAALLISLYLGWRKQAVILRSLTETRQRLAIAGESGSFGVWEWDVESGQVHCDESWFALVGGERRERSLTSAEMTASVHPADLRGLLAAVSDMLRGKTQTYDVEHRMHTLDGRCIWVRSRGKVMKRGPDGRAQRVFGIVADISERVALAEAQHDSRALLLSQQADLLQCFNIAALHWGDAYVVLPQIVELATKALSADRVSLWYYGEAENAIVCADCYETSSARHFSGTQRDAAHLPAAMRKPESGGAIRDARGRLTANRNEFFVDEIVAAGPSTCRS